MSRGLDAARLRRLGAVQQGLHLQWSGMTVFPARWHGPTYIDLAIALGKV